MKKTIIAGGLISSLMLPGFAIADNDFELFGILYGEAGFTEEGADAESRQYLGDENGMGRIGVRGSHDIGDKLSLVGVAAWNLNVGDDHGTDTLSTRNLNVGLSGVWGTVRFGSFDGAYKITGGPRFDAFSSTGLQARTHGGMATGPFGTTNYFHNAVQYESPDLQGLNAIVQYSFDERDRGGDLDNYKGAYNIGLTYDFLDNLRVIVATNSVKTENDGREGNHKIGLQAGFGDFTAFFQYEDVSIMGRSVADADIWFTGLRYRVFDDLILVGQYAQLDDSDSRAGGDQTYYAVGGRYFFDNRTSAYFGYKNTEFDDSGQSDLGTAMVSLRYNFSVSP